VNWKNHSIRGRAILALGVASAVVGGAIAAAATPAGLQTPGAIKSGAGPGWPRTLHPNDFVARVDNPRFPLKPGSRWHYRGVDADGRFTDNMRVKHRTKKIEGVRTTVVHDVVLRRGKPREVTNDWYAQDRDGNVWYFGEAVRNFDQGRFEGTDGSWEAGVDGALPGIVMPADPTPGHAYRQEFYEGEAEDLGQILRTGQQESVAFGSFTDVIVTRDWNPLEPDVVEEKSYAPGIGLVSETTVAGGHGAAELVSFTKGDTG
jgi:hypothetical protein